MSQVWVFAGGGDSEIFGLMPFLQTHFPHCHFERKSPVNNKPGPKPNSKPRHEPRLQGEIGLSLLEPEPNPKLRSKPRHEPRPQGETGLFLLEVIKKRLNIALATQGKCDIIFIFDDLDYREKTTAENELRTAIQEILAYHSATNIQVVVAFGKPEIESWIIANWHNTIGRDAEFRAIAGKCYHWLEKKRFVAGDNPENFGLDPSLPSYHTKLSEAIIEAVQTCAAAETQTPYSKALHTPRFVRQLNPDQVKAKCPVFRAFFEQLQTMCHP